MVNNRNESQDKNEKHIAIIGGGPGGYVAAIRAAQLGAHVTLIEKDRLGGTCLNVGCIPTKALLHSAEIVAMAKTSQQFGIKLPKPEIDWESVQKYKSDVSLKLQNGVKMLLKSRKVNVIAGEASFASDKSIRVSTGSSVKRIQADEIVIATGSLPIIPPIKGIKDNEDCIDSTACLELSKIPESLLVVGGGVIGIELASAYAKFGTKVIIVEKAPNILPTFDSDLSDFIGEKLKELGVEIHVDSSVEAVVKQEKGSDVHISFKERVVSKHVEKILISVGRKPNFDALNLQALGIKTESGRIAVNEFFETSQKNIYAIGDCVGKAMLAHTASAMGEYVVEKIMGLESAFFEDVNPACVYTSPEIASVGKTEAALKAGGIPYEVGRFDMMSNGKSLILGHGEGFIKVLAGKAHKEILGVHIMGEKATELIAEAALAIRLEATVDEIATTTHAHPTISEAFREAVLAVEARAIHSK